MVDISTTPAAERLINDKTSYNVHFNLLQIDFFGGGAFTIRIEPHSQVNSLNPIIAVDEWVKTKLTNWGLEKYYAKARCGENLLMNCKRGTRSREK